MLYIVPAEFEYNHYIVVRLDGSNLDIQNYFTTTNTFFQSVILQLVVPSTLLCTVELNETSPTCVTFKFCKLDFNFQLSVTKLFPHYSTYNEIIPILYDDVHLVCHSTHRC